eukprot:85934-Rhodomonas_salina.1
MHASVLLSIVSVERVTSSVRTQVFDKREAFGVGDPNGVGGVIKVDKKKKKKKGAQTDEDDEVAVRSFHHAPSCQRIHPRARRARVAATPVGAMLPAFVGV